MWGYFSRVDWFNALMGFREEDYGSAKRQMEVVEVEGRAMLRSKVTGKAYGCGELELVSLETLRQRVAALGPPPEGGRGLRFGVVTGDIRAMHPRLANCLIQVASQFNLLEMVGPGVTPEDGVSGYAGDPTQGPACAIACGAGTIFRNYFAPCNGSIGQTATNQLDGIKELGDLLCDKMNRPHGSLWRMRNGYCMPNRDTLADISNFLSRADEDTLDQLRAKLAIGLHTNVEITDGREDRSNPLFCSQAYCSALPVSYAGRGPWDEFATLVLESLYESTLLAGILRARSEGGNNVVLLTQVGGGAFGNSRLWIEQAVRRALNKVREWDLDVKMVCYGGADRWISDLVNEFHPRSASPLRSLESSGNNLASDDDDDDDDDDDEDMAEGDNSSSSQVLEEETVPMSQSLSGTMP